MVGFRPGNEHIHHRRMEKQFLHPFQRAKPRKIAEQADAIIADSKSPRFMRDIRSDNLNILHVPDTQLIVMSDVDPGLERPVSGTSLTTSEAMPEIPDPPKDLGAFVPAVRQRHDHVIVRLRKGVAVAGALFPALSVGVQNGRVGCG